MAEPGGSRDQAPVDSPEAPPPQYLPLGVPKGGGVPPG